MMEDENETMCEKEVIESLFQDQLMALVPTPTEKSNSITTPLPPWDKRGSFFEKCSRCWQG